MALFSYETTRGEHDRLPSAEPLKAGLASLMRPVDSLICHLPSDIICMRVVSNT